MNKQVIIFLCLTASLFGDKTNTDSLMSPESELVIEASLADSDREALKKESPNTLSKIDQKKPLTVDDIKKMSKADLSDTAIISQIDATHSVFYLSTAEIIDLKQLGVSQKVIDYMIKTGNH